MQPTVGELPYAMAKSALHTMTAALSHDYAGRVRKFGGLINEAAPTVPVRRSSDRERA